MEPDTLREFTQWRVLHMFAMQSTRIVRTVIITLHYALMRLVHYIAGAILLSFFAFVMLFVLYGLGALFAYVVNTLVDLIRNGGHLNAWQGAACLAIGGGLFHVFKQKTL